MNIGFISTRLAGTDGVSLETAKLAQIVRRTGHQAFYCAGVLAETRLPASQHHSCAAAAASTNP